MRLTDDKTEHFFASIDWELFERQMTTLAIHLDQRREALEDLADDDEQQQDMEGILNVMAGLKDLAVAEYGVPDMTGYPSVGKCVFCHRPLFDHMGPTLVDDTEGDICDANYPHCLGFEPKDDGTKFCRNCEVHEEDH